MDDRDWGISITLWRREQSPFECLQHIRSIRARLSSSIHPPFSFLEGSPNPSSLFSPQLHAKKCWCDFPLWPQTSKTNCCKSQFPRLRAISKVKLYSHRRFGKKVMYAFISSSLDYFNSLYIICLSLILGLPEASPELAVRLLTTKRKKEHISHFLAS